MKYVMFVYDVNRNTLPVPQPCYFFVMFPDEQIHSEIAGAVRDIKQTEDFGATWSRAVPVSAGFIGRNRYNSGYQCFGYSESLRMKMHPDDDRIINEYSTHKGLGFDRRS